MNPLANNPAARKLVYQLFWLVSLVLGAVAAWYGAADASIPDWYTPTAGVFAFVSAAVGYQASANTNGNDEG
jgi:hypothetical protein